MLFRSAIRTDGDWEGWVAFFLEGVAVASADAERSIIDVASLITADRKRLLVPPKPDRSATACLNCCR